jgi:hypothetical protein
VLIPNVGTKKAHLFSCFRVVLLYFLSYITWEYYLLVITHSFPVNKFIIPSCIANGRSVHVRKSCIQIEDNKHCLQLLSVIFGISVPDLAKHRLFRTCYRKTAKIHRSVTDARFVLPSPYRDEHFRGNGRCTFVQECFVTIKHCTFLLLV